MKRILLATASVATVALTLTACSSSTSETATPTASESSSMTGDVMVGQDPATWAPVVVTPDMNGGVVSMVEGQAGTIEGLPSETDMNMIQVVSSDPMIIEPIQPYNGDWVGGAGFMAKSVGMADVSVIDTSMDATGGASNVIMMFTVNVTMNPTGGDGTTMMDSTIVGNDPATWAPTVVTADMMDVNLVVGQNVVFPDYAYGSDMNYTIVSSDESVAKIAMDDNSVVPSFSAVGAGEATVTVFDGYVDEQGVVEVQTLKVTVE